jgi:hypothetical protein
MARNRPGRPPLDPQSSSPSAAVCLKLRARDFDAADRLAKQQRTSIQDVLRRGLKRILHDERGGTL